MTARAQDQGDRLLWLLGGAVGAVALTSFALVFWPGSDSRVAPAAAAPTAAAIEAPPPLPPAARSSSEAPLLARLNRAQLALDAGMLLEPEGFSAFSLYADILEEAPGHAVAAAGLAAVAEAIVDEARLAASEGRDGEADALLARVLARFPDHPDALLLRNRPRSATAAAPAPPELRSIVPAPALPAVDLAPRPRSEPPLAITLARVDRVVEIYPQFTRALAAGALLAPPEASAEHFVNEMRTTDPIHRMTRDAEQQLFDALFSRYETAFDGLDTSAALDWLAAADLLSVDVSRVAAARQAVADFVAARAENEIVPASDLTILDYVSPTYPSSAQRRGIDGWVDIEFVVDVDGTPRNVVAVASSQTLFEQEAIEAVTRWRFEPHRITGRIVEQRAQTRIRFVIE